MALYGHSHFFFFMGWQVLCEGYAGAMWPFPISHFPEMAGVAQPFALGPRWQESCTHLFFPQDCRSNVALSLFLEMAGVTQPFSFSEMVVVM